MREVVTILGQTVSETTPDGFPVETRPAIASSIWARMQPRKASELTLAMRETVDTRMICTIRQRPGLDGACRVVWRGRTFDVEAFSNPDEQMRYLALDLKEIMP